MYGIRDRSPFVQYQTGLQATKNGSQLASESTKRYYSSIDAEIYFGNFYIDEVVQIAYEVSQNTMPLFGYNSYVFDEVALGSRLIRGQFSINFTSPSYLFTIMDQIEKDSIVSIASNATKEEDGNEAGTRKSEGKEIAKATDEDAIKPDEVEEHLIYATNQYTTTDYTQIPRGRRPLYRVGFDIDIMFGQEDMHNGAKHVLLEGVYLMSSSVNLDASGTPIAETYSFIARDIVPID